MGIGGKEKPLIKFRLRKAKAKRLSVLLAINMLIQLSCFFAYKIEQRIDHTLPPCFLLTTDFTQILAGRTDCINVQP